MFKSKADAGWQAIPLAVSLCALACATPAMSQTADTAPAKKEKRPAVSQAKPTSPNATINLVNMLVSQGVIKEEQAQLLIKQAEDEAYVSRQAAKDATAKADDAAKAASAAAAAAQPPGTRHVTYVPEVVKRQLRDEIKKEVMAKAQKENWASPGAYPEWAQRIRFYGDARVRYQGSYFPSGNDQVDAWNFNSINTGSPYDYTNSNKTLPSTYNTTQDRNQFRLRARLGMEADLYNGFTAGLRIATGESNSPVSTNQTMGNSGGNFSKYSLWLDRGYLKYQTFGDDLTLSAGRFDNPFWSPTDLVWYRELGFDGFAVQAKREVWEGITPFAVAGAFPTYNTDFNAGITPSGGGTTKFASHDKWLFGAQVGVAAKISPEYSFRLGVAYYDFTNVQGRVSSPCDVKSASDTCDTDLTRPSFAQKGNSYTVLRSIYQTFDNNFGQSLQYQYFGLASQFRPLVASAQLDLGHFHPYHIVIDGEYVVNTAFDRNYMNLNAINNRVGTNSGVVGPYNGGNTGWMGRLTVGNKEIKHLGDWNVHVGYKYLESDAVIDAFADSDFGLGGTNLKGYFLGGNLGLSENVWASLRWMSANNIAGFPYNVDVLQVDLNARF
ncbi:putative porin [Bradyrhizobium sp. U87765 SZCCT0131]|uniref:putative porin n=1 Tax=unclassified Bradyrhizobium TaxID=2631580 RepID=UPI001BA6A3AA|nr:MULTISPECIES: putative porin [unclassified Bradyrhizobium]MBR1221256.1 putative porin [Bradyrhizobium sp. U87765 SZCCT0131]MBR1259923.1 putative porin [Bradyrhizobium sp. U87765 SZCCT0134]MBR1307828.1 putative porin [Bradyrhizobium sp. U87765 SZCCT0110]MBR1321782.1 putative porin [Bradyrhizobium sp. U87765 SZCCT0109]MBR1350094.1 putative porin [Bradyrhizobium sp. U87765 SZCCT0048]